MLLNKKLVSHAVWIILAFLIGIGISYTAIKGGEIAFGAIYDKTQEFVLKKSNTVAQNILVAQVNDPPTIITNNNAESFIKSTDSLNSLEEKTVSIGFVGDIIPGVNPSENIFSNVVSYTENVDVMIGNFEGVIAQNSYSKCKQNSLNCFSFNSDNKF